MITMPQFAGCVQGSRWFKDRGLRQPFGLGLGVLGALVLGVGMCMVMVFEQMTLGVVIGLVGIVILLMLIPLVRGIHD